MRKVILTSTIAVFCLGGFLSLNHLNKAAKLSKLQIENIEAVASGESNYQTGPADVIESNVTHYQMKVCLCEIDYPYCEETIF